MALGAYYSMHPKESRKKMEENYKCNMSEAGTMCEVHGTKQCPGYTEDGKGKQLLTPSQQNEDLAVPMLGEGGDDEEAVEMIKVEMKAIANKALNLLMTMPDTMHVEPWVQAKIAQAKEMISSVHDYMVYGDHDKDDDKESAPGDVPVRYTSGTADDPARI